MHGTKTFEALKMNSTCFNRSVSNFINKTVYKRLTVKQHKPFKHTQEHTQRNFKRKQEHRSAGAKRSAVGAVLKKISIKNCF